MAGPDCVSAWASSTGALTSSAAKAGGLSTAACGGTASTYARASAIQNLEAIQRKVA